MSYRTFPSFCGTILLSPMDCTHRHPHEPRAMQFEPKTHVFHQRLEQNGVRQPCCSGRRPATDKMSLCHPFRRSLVWACSDLCQNAVRHDLPQPPPFAGRWTLRVFDGAVQQGFHPVSDRVFNAAVRHKILPVAIQTSHAILLAIDCLCNFQIARLRHRPGSTSVNAVNRHQSALLKDSIASIRSGFVSV